MTNHDDDDDNMSDEEVEAVVQAAVGELLNLAAGVADLQTTDEAADEILVMCDLIAEYFQIERAEIETVANDDGSYTSRVVERNNNTQPELRSESIPGHIRTQGHSKYRLRDRDDPVDDLEDE